MSSIKSLKKAFKSKGSSSRPGSIIGESTSKGSPNVPSFSYTGNAEILNELQKKEKEGSMGPCKPLVSSKDSRPPPKTLKVSKKQKFPSMRGSTTSPSSTTTANPDTVESSSIPSMSVTRKRSLSLSETEKAKSTAPIQRRKQAPEATKPPKNIKHVETTHKIFTYLCTRHPWFAENWYKENTEITDQTFVDIVAILSGEVKKILIRCHI